MNNSEKSSYSWIQLPYKCGSDIRKFCLSAISKTIICGASSLCLKKSPTFVSKEAKYHLCTVTLSGQIVVKSINCHETYNNMMDNTLNHDYETENQDEDTQEEWDASKEKKKYTHVQISQGNFTGKIQMNKSQHCKTFKLAADAARYVDLKMKEAGLVNARLKPRILNFKNENIMNKQGKMKSVEEV